ncbi:MAG: RNA-binding protein [Alphaproteobacteria bacterium]|nr:RNA-binding protein [Alphaproteobacteria bacterium]
MSTSGPIRNDAKPTDEGRVLRLRPAEGGRGTLRLSKAAPAPAPSESPHAGDAVVSSSPGRLSAPGVGPSRGRLVTVVFPQQHRDAPPRRSGGHRRNDKVKGNIFVANLPRGFTDEQLAAAFDEYGIVLGAFLARDQMTGEPKNHGLVNIAPQRAADAAVAAMNGKTLGGRKIEVRLADPNMALTVPNPRRIPSPAEG